MTINKGKLINTVGWSTVVIGLFLVTISVKYGYEANYGTTNKPRDNIIDADFTIINE